jgi:hypothetical protein
MNENVLFHEKIENIFQILIDNIRLYGGEQVHICSKFDMCIYLYVHIYEYIYIFFSYFFIFLLFLVIFDYTCIFMYMN